MRSARPPPSRRTLRIGLAASQAHRTAAAGALFRLLMPLEETIRNELDAEIIVLGLTHDATVQADLLASYPGLLRLPSRRGGGLIHQVAAVVSGDPARRPDAVIYLLDPDDPTALFPEAQALERECVIHETVFVSTLAHAQQSSKILASHASMRPTSNCSNGRRGRRQSVHCASAIGQARSAGSPAVWLARSGRRSTQRRRESQGHAARRT